MITETMFQDIFPPTFHNFFLNNEKFRICLMRLLSLHKKVCPWHCTALEGHNVMGCGVDG